MTQPANILIVVVDSMRADHVGCYGHDRDTTLNIDALAGEGCRFDRAITAAPFSPSSYASLISNQYVHQHGVNGDSVRVWPDNMPRLPERLKAAGYSTFALSNNSFFLTETNSAKGFDTFIDRDDSRGARLAQKWYQRVRRHLGDAAAKRLSNRMHCQAKGDSEKTIERTIDLIRSQKSPWFGFVILMDPHTPYDRRHTYFAGRGLPVRRFFNRYNSRAMWAELMAWRGTLDETNRRVVNDLYDSEIRHSDRCIGRLVDAMRTMGQLDDTLLAVTADHGEGFGEHGVWGHGFCLNDCLTRVPLVLRCPRYFEAGAVFEGLVQLHDLHETCLQVADETVSQPHALTQASDPDWAARDAVFSAFPLQTKTLAFMNERNPRFEPGRWGHAMWAVRTDRWRYIAYDDGTHELYDLAADPGETHTVHDQHPDVCADLAARLGVHRSDRPSQPATTETSEQLDEAVAERLRALGYIE